MTKVMKILQNISYITENQKSNVMKKLCIILMIGLCATLSAQEYYTNLDFSPKKKEFPQWGKTLIGYTSAILLDAVGDALNDDGQKGWGHACNAASVGILLSSPLWSDMNKDNWGWHLASYVSLRFAIFDPIYNKTRGLDWDYRGNSSVTDKMWNKLNPPSTFFPRAVIFSVGVTIPIKSIK